MKNLMKTIVAVFFLSFLVSCGSQNLEQSKNLAGLVETESFTFIAEEANINPYNFRVEETNEASRTLGKIPNFRERQYFVNGKMQPLDSGYRISVTKNELEVILPFFGEYNKKWTTNITGMIRTTTADTVIMQFTSSAFTVEQEINKKGTKTITIIAKDAKDPIKIKMEVFKSGKTFATIDPGSSTSFSYKGYVRSNLVAKN